MGTRRYFMVGTIFGGWNPEDKRLGHGEQLNEWISKGEWQLGWRSYLEKSPKYLKQLKVLNQVMVGDVLIAKQMNPDFKSMKIKAIGICIKESTDGHKLGVDWRLDTRDNPIIINSSYRPTISKMSSSSKSKLIIRDVIEPLLEGSYASER